MNFFQNLKIEAKIALSVIAGMFLVGAILAVYFIANSGDTGTPTAKNKGSIVAPSANPSATATNKAGLTPDQQKALDEIKKSKVNTDINGDDDDSPSIYNEPATSDVNIGDNDDMTDFEIQGSNAANDPTEAYCSRNFAETDAQRYSRVSTYFGKNIPESAVIGTPNITGYLYRTCSTLNSYPYYHKGNIVRSVVYESVQLTPTADGKNPIKKNGKTVVNQETQTYFVSMQHVKGNSWIGLKIGTTSGSVK